MKRLHVASNTHWDREHRHGIQETRCMLVEMMDRLIGIMETDPHYRHFTLDGQFSPIDDYLQIRPDMADRVKKLVASGRILIGPWYTLPDMNAVNPESLVRNLLMGDTCCRAFGGKMNLGYSIFSFGQIAQLPQLYNGVGIKNLVVYKHFSPQIIKQSEFIWTAPDGTSILASRLGSLFRVNFFVSFSVPVILGGEPMKPGWAVRFTDATRLAHMVDGHYRTHYATELEPDIRIRRELIPKAVEDVMNSVRDSAAQNTFLAFDGIDFSFPLREIPEAINIANEQAGSDVTLVHSTLMAYFDEFRKEVNLQKLLSFSGELRFGPMGDLHSESQSANIELKQANHRAETTILRYAEPFSAFGHLQGGNYPEAQLDYAWKYLFQSQAHDSIHGTGVPKIKRDTLYRLEQAQEMADSLARRAFETLALQIDTSTCRDDDVLVTIFNPTAREYRGVVNLQIDLPQAEFITEFHLETMEGQRLDLYENTRKKAQMAAINGENRPKAVACDRRDIDVSLPAIPAYGYTTLRTVRQKNECEHVYPFADPTFAYQPVAQTPNILNNGLLLIEVLPNGSLNITDMEQGFTYQGLNVYCDSGCAGDLWIHKLPAENQWLTTYGSHADINIVRSSPLLGRIRIEHILHVPVSLTQDRSARSPHTTPIKITTCIELKKHSRQLDFRVTMNNTAADHRLSVGFVTGIATDYVYTENPFEIRRRPVDVTVNQNGHVDKTVVLRQPLHSFLDVSDGRRGIALFTKGLKEYESRYTHDKTVALELTLLRAVTQTFPVHNDVFVEFPEDQSSQCQGPQTFEYALYFHPGDHTTSEVISESQRYQTPPTAIQYGKGTGRGILPREHSFLKVSHPHMIILGIKKARESGHLVLRLNNPTRDTLRDHITLAHPIQAAWLTDLLEHPQEPLAFAGNGFDIELRPYKIQTVLIELRPPQQ